MGWLAKTDEGKKQYRDICLTIGDPATSGTILWPSVLTNAFENDRVFLDTLVSRTHEYVDAAPANFYRRNTLGAALYRAGRFEEAIRELEKARAARVAEQTNILAQTYDHLIRIPISPPQEGRPEDWVFLAMANAKLGRRTEAWNWMRKVRDAPELAQAIRAQSGLPASNSALALKPSYPVAYRTLALELLYSEAFATLAPRNPPPVASGAR
jgi:tetratricopeptide (TPR) repeat protein